MELSTIIKSRRSIRSFKRDKEISKDVINKILEAAIWAPTAGNVQPWRFFVITNQDIKEQLVSAALDQEFIRDASVVIVVCTNKTEANLSYGKRGVELYSIQDTAAAIQNMLLTVHSLGLGSCWVGAFSEEMAAKILNLPQEIRPVAILPIGYQAESPSAPKRKSLNTVIDWIK